MQNIVSWYVMIVGFMGFVKECRKIQSINIYIEYIRIWKNIASLQDQKLKFLFAPPREYLLSSSLIKFPLI